ncbi:MAG: uracil-DNA glycosylase family protein [Brucellaceae bacterium]|nr:uracil-DNA glycosylase family protein [Brucellaceae bacterium]
MAEQKRIARLAGEIAACRLCRDAPDRKPALPHEPRPVAVLSPTACILIAGQAPGIRVHDSGIPFNDPSGDRLRQWMGIGRDVFYDASRIAILPMGFCFPGYDAKGGDLPPRRECAPQWRTRCLDLMPQIELVLCIGQYAHAWHLGGLRRKTLTETVAAWRDILTPDKSPKVIALPHPSWRNSGWLKRNPWFDAELVPWLQATIAEMVVQKSPD